MLSGKVIQKCEGHREEVYSLKKVQFNNKNYLLTSSEDGRFIKWSMNDDFRYFYIYFYFIYIYYYLFYYFYYFIYIYFYLFSC